LVELGTEASSKCRDYNAPRPTVFNVAAILLRWLFRNPEKGKAWGAISEKHADG
jgi:hypothetical protein